MDVGVSRSVSCLTQHRGPTTIKLLLMVYREKNIYLSHELCVFVFLFSSVFMKGMLYDLRGFVLAAVVNAF